MNFFIIGSARFIGYHFAITRTDITSSESKLTHKPGTLLGDGLKSFTDWFKTEEKCDI